MKILDLSHLSFLKPSVASVLIWVNYGLSFLFLFFGSEVMNGNQDFGPVLFLQLSLSYGITVYTNLTFLRILQSQFQFRKADVWVALMLLATLWNFLPASWKVFELIPYQYILVVSIFSYLLSICLMIVVMQMKDDLYDRKWQVTISTILTQLPTIAWTILFLFDIYTFNGILENKYILYLLFFVCNIFYFQVFRRAAKAIPPEDQLDQLIENIGNPPP